MHHGTVNAGSDTETLSTSSLHTPTSSHAHTHSNPQHYHHPFSRASSPLTASGATGPLCDAAYDAAATTRSNFPAEYPLRDHQRRDSFPPAPSRVAQREVRFSTTCMGPACTTRSVSAEDWVRLNVGGRVFITTLSTLTSDRDTLLSRIAEALIATRQLRAESAQPSRSRPLQSGGTAGATTSPLAEVATAARGSDGTASVGGDDPEAAEAAVAVAASATVTPTATETGIRGDIRWGGADSSPAAAASAGGGGEVLTPTSGGEHLLLQLDSDSHDSILLDLDPDYFGPVLNYLRHRVVVVPPHLSARGVLAIAEYLNVQGIVRQLAPARHRRRQLLFSWGSGSNGELGTQTFADCPTPTPVQITPFGVKVRTMALGANYSCALGDDGNIYACGNGDWGQLGLGSPKELDTHPTDKSAVAVIPRRIPLFERRRAVHVAAGYAFAMAITSDYHVYFWGNNNHGQSGLGPALFDQHLKKIDEPRLVESLEGKRIVQLGCGSFFSLALSEDGSLYSWGLVECLGLGTPDEVQRRFRGTGVLGESLSSECRCVVLTPQRVHFRKGISSGSAGRITRIHAGQWHTGAISAAGELFTWGVGYQGRLGHGTKEPAYVPTRVRGALEGQRVVDVACGSFHTVVLTDTGAVFCWGDNASGQCGTSANRTEAVMLPYRVVGLEFVAGGVARGISCGRQHTVVVMEGPQPHCLEECCRLDYQGRPKRPHAQVYLFGEGARGLAGTAAASGSATAAASTAAGSGAGGLRTLSGAALTRPGGGPGSAGSSTMTAPAGAAGYGSAQYTPIGGLEHLDVCGVVSGLHHTFAYAEEINVQRVDGARPGLGDVAFTGAGYLHSRSGNSDVEHDNDWMLRHAEYEPYTHLRDQRQQHRGWGGSWAPAPTGAAGARWAGTVHNDPNHDLQ